MDHRRLFFVCTYVESNSNTFFSQAPTIHASEMHGMTFVEEDIVKFFQTVDDAKAYISSIKSDTQNPQSNTNIEKYAIHEVDFPTVVGALPSKPAIYQWFQEEFAINDNSNSSARNKTISLEFFGVSLNMVFLVELVPIRIHLVDSGRSIAVDTSEIDPQNSITLN